MHKRMKIFDLHAHPSLKAFGSLDSNNREYDIWSERFNEYKRRQVIKQIDDDGFYRSTSPTLAGRLTNNLLEDNVAMYSQSNLDHAVEGGLRCIVHSIYPVEQEFFKRGRKYKKHEFDAILSMISGQSVEKIDEIQKGSHSYFQEYQSDRKNLHDHELSGSRKNPLWKYKIVSNYQEISDTVNRENEIAIILSVEGVQSLANKIAEKNNYRQLKKEADRNSNDFEKWKTGLLNNLKSIKQSKDEEGNPVQPVLFLTIAHHFFNYVCGHCKSISPNLAEYAIDQTDFYIDHSDNETHKIHYFNLGITKGFGEDVIKELLRRDTLNGIRRIIPDIKHMSPQARIDFYQLLDSPEFKNEDIPIICSHTSVNGVKDLRRTKQKDQHQFFNTADINTFDMDIIEIYKRNGLIGLMLDDGRSCSKEYRKIVTNLDNKIERKVNKALKIRETFGQQNSRKARRKLEYARQLDQQVEVLKEEIENEYCDIFFRQLFHIIYVIDNALNAGEKAWNIITLGTDFDGVINPYDYYGSYARMNHFRDDLIERWNEHLEECKEEGIENNFTRYLFGKSPEHWIDSVFWNNAIKFLQKYFHDDYLIHGRTNSNQ